MTPVDINPHNQTQQSAPSHNHESRYPGVQVEHNVAVAPEFQGDSSQTDNHIQRGVDKYIREERIFLKGEDLWLWGKIQKQQRKKYLRVLVTEF